MATPRLSRALGALGWGLLSLLALAGVALSGAVLYAASPVGRPVVAGAAVRIVDDALAGRFELEGIGVLPQGGVEVLGLRVFDPEERLVLAVDRARVFADVTRLRGRELGLVVELDGPAVLLEEGEEGLSLARAFAPSRPRLPTPEPEEPAGDGLALRVSRLAVRGGAVWWVDAAGETRLEVSQLDLQARGLWSARHGSAELWVRGASAEPVTGPLALDAAISRDGDAVSLPLLAARLGGTSIEVAGYADLAARTGRASVRRFSVDRFDARGLTPVAGEGVDLEGAAYAEADGHVVSVALAVAPLEASAPGRAEVAAALALDGSGASGFDVALDRVDPSRLHAEAPAAEVTLTARGAFEGRRLDALRARLELSLSPSRLRGGRLGPATISARAERGTVRVERLDLRAPGLSLAGAGTWRESGAVSGKVAAEAADVAAAVANVGALLGEPLPRASGRLRVDAALSGTSAAPALIAHVESDALRAFDLAVRALRLDVEVSGPLRAPSGKVSGRAAALATGGTEVARALALDAELAREGAQLDVQAAVPALGEERVSLAARARLGPRRETLELSALTLGYPGARWALAAPATVRFDGPSVDRLELASGAQRLALQGGLGKRGALAARLEAEGVDLGHLPAAWVLPGLAGRVSLDAQAGGTTARPEVTARVRLAGGAWRSLSGLDLGADVRLDAPGRRLAGKLSLARAAGGTLDAEAELPWPVEARGPLRVAVAAERLPLEELLAAAEVDASVEGWLAAQVRLEGTVGAPRLGAELRLTDGAFIDLFPLVARVAVADEGERLALDVGVELDGDEALSAKAAWQLALAALLADPEAAATALRTAPLQAEVRVPGLALQKLAGALGIPEDLTGRLDAEAVLAGSLAAPRGKVRAALAGTAVAGYRDVDADLSAELGAASLSAAGAVAVAGSELATFRGSLAAAPEALLDPAALRGAPLSLDLTIPEGTLARASGATLPLTGSLRGTLSARGTLAAPRVEAALSGAGVGIQGRPLGEVAAEARYADGRATARVALEGASGGGMTAAVQLDAPLGLGADLSGLPARPVELRLQAEGLDLGIAPALAPGVVRSAAGRLDADVVARGPLARPSPRGTLTVAGGKASVSEYGEWTDLAIDAEVTDDAVELRALRVRRGSGRLEAAGALRGLASGRAELQGRAKAEALTIARAGMALATFDLDVTATGSYADDLLDAELRIPRGIVRLPDRLPRELQDVEQRPDIQVGKPKEPRRPRRAASATAAPAAVKPLELKIRAIANDQLFVRSNTPRIDLELKADVTYGITGGESYAEGSVDVIRGLVELIGSRAFEVQRGRVQFTGGPPTAALLDVQALYDNPAAKVTVVVTGPLLAPDFRLSSQPPMDEAQIAMLIATGRTELKPGAGGVENITGEEAGKAAVSALATQVFKNVVADKLPLDTVALDAGALRAGKYVTDKIYVGYTRRFDADPNEQENTDEVRVEYRISPRWTFESRYGNAPAGGASLIWSKDY